MKPILRSIIVCVVLTWGISTSPAQDEEGIRLTFAVLEEDPPTFFFNPDPGQGEAMREITIYRNFRGRPLTVQSRDPLTLHRQSTGPDGESVYEPVLDVAIPASGDQFLVLLQKQKKREGKGWSATLLDDSEQAHPRETLRLFNMHPQVMRYALKGGGTGMIQPGAEALIRYPELSGEFPRIILAVALELKQDGKLERVPDFVHQVFPGTRLLVFSNVFRQVDGEDYHQRLTLVDRVDE